MRTSDKSPLPNDEELKTPAHDKLCLWVSDNWKEIIKTVYPTTNDFIFTDFRLKLSLEPIIEPPYKPPVFPDAIIDIINKQNVIFISLIIECKPTINSFGSTVRQMNLYLQRYTQLYHITLTNLVLITPDIRYDKYFKRENIKVVHPSSIVLKEALPSGVNLATSTPTPTIVKMIADNEHNQLSG